MRTCFAALALSLAAGCGTDTIEHGSPDSSAADRGVARETSAGEASARDGAESGTLSIWIRGDLTPTSFSDGLAGQTPKPYTMGLGRFDLMTSSADPSPVTVFDHGTKPVEVDLLGLTLGGSAKLSALKPGSYSWGRVLLTSSTFTVATTVHVGVPVGGTIKVQTALSDTTLEGKPWTQGQTTFTFAAGSFQQTLPATLPPLPTTGGGSIVQTGGRTWLVFPFPTPLSVGPSAKDHKATIVYKVFESFRWQDEVKAGYTAKVFDVDGLALSFEPVKSFGATGYAIETE